MTEPQNIYKSVGETYKTGAKFAEMDQEIFRRLQGLGFTPRIIFDVGASDGSWSKDMVEVLPQAEFHLFEPLITYAPAYQVIMQENLRQYPNFQLHHWALGETTGRTTINTFPNLVASTVLDLSESGLTTIPVQVEMTTLNELIAQKRLPPPEVIKIDTQGYELAILKGATEILAQTSVLLLECWLYRGYGRQTPLLLEIINFLEPLGFCLWDLGDTYRGENQVLATLDCAFVNRQLREKLLSEC